MHSFFRKNKKTIVWVVVVAFIFGGALMGFGAYNMFSSGGRSAQQVASIATVNKEPVTFDEFYSNFQRYQSILNGAPADMFIMYQYQTLNEVIQNKLLLQEAKNEKIKATVTNEDVDQYIEDFKANYGIDDAKIEELLKDANMTMDKWKNNIKEALYEPKLIENLFTKITGEITVTDQEVIDEYEEVRASTIYVKAEDRTKIEEALTKVKAGEDFAEVAKTYSAAPSAPNGGDLGFFNRGTFGMDVKMVQRSFELDVDQISDIVEGNDGLYVIKVTGKKIAEGEEWEAQKEDIKTRLISLKEAQIQSQWFEELEAKANIQILVPELAGYKALNEQEYDTAIAKFNEAIAQTPGNGAFYTYLANAYKGKGQIDKAIETYHKAIEDATVSWNLYYDLGWTLKEAGEIDKAIVNLQKASEEAGDEKWAHDRLKTAFESMGYKELALQEEAIIADIEAKEAEAAAQWAEQQKALDEAAAQQDSEQTEPTGESTDTTTPAPETTEGDN